MKINPILAFKDNYIWLFTDTNRAAVVDPGDSKLVLKVLEDRNLVLDTILITHHHFDHTGGVSELKASTGCKVLGPKNNSIDGIDLALGEGDSTSVLGIKFSVMEVPGHTLDHIAYYSQAERVLFCGDTLFVGGCGRVFEGTFPMMQKSLAKLASLPGETKVFCTHEYTLANLMFARTVEPDNHALQKHYEVCRSKRETSVPTVPSTIACELEINPFLRWDSPDITKRLKALDRFSGEGPVEVFTAVRSWKDEG